MVRRYFVIISACLALSGCGSSAPQVMRPPTVSQFVVQKGGGAQWVQLTARTSGDFFKPIVAGPDKNIWFIDSTAGSDLVRMTMSGAVKVIASINSNGDALIVGSDKKFYLLGGNSQVVQVTTKGVMKTFTIPSGDSTQLNTGALGPDGNVWFAEAAHIAKISPTGVITEYAYPDTSSPNMYGGVATGSDGNVWFAQSSLNYIGKVDPTTGQITTFAITSACTPAAVVAAKDSDIWFACLASTMLGRITPDGTITLFPIGANFTGNATMQFGARGPDGEPWFASASGAIILRVNTATQTATTFNPPLASGEAPEALTPGPDGNIWVDTAGAHHVDVLVFNPMTVTPISLKFTAPGLVKSVTVAENGVAAWTATSSNASVATVAQGGSPNVFKVTSAGVGSCKVTIADGVGNSVAVKVTVL